MAAVMMMMVAVEWWRYDDDGSGGVAAGGGRKARGNACVGGSGIKAMGLESVSIRRIQGVGYGVLEFLGVGTTFDIFQNILFPYSLNILRMLSWIQRIGLVSFVVFGECRHRYAVSSLMDTAYWLSEQ
ncbi:hypothetical protein Tco_1410866 [Tanacetum coccineum]